MRNIRLLQHKNQDLKELPFSIKANPNLVGRAKEKELLIKFIKNGNVCFLTGPTGVGKSSLLLWLAENLKSHNMFYIDAANIESGFSIKEFLKNSRMGFDRFRGYPKNCVILLDESQDCDFELQKALKLHWDHNHIKSIVVTQIDPNLENFSVSFRDRVGSRVIKLGKMSKDDAIGLIKARCGNVFDAKVMDEIVKRADYMPRKILEFCELLSIGGGEKPSDVKKILKKGLKKNRKSTPSAPKTKNEKTLDQPKVDLVKEYEICELGGAHQKRLTLLQKNIILGIGNGHKTANEIALGLEEPVEIIENELKNLYENKIITMCDLKKRR